MRTTPERTKVINVRFSESELKQVRDAATAAELTVAAWIRQQCAKGA